MTSRKPQTIITNSKRGRLTGADAAMYKGLLNRTSNSLVGKAEAARDLFCRLKDEYEPHNKDKPKGAGDLAPFRELLELCKRFHTEVEVWMRVQFKALKGITVWPAMLIGQNAIKRHIQSQRHMLSHVKTDTRAAAEQHTRIHQSEIGRVAEAVAEGMYLVHMMKGAGLNDTDKLVNFVNLLPGVLPLPYLLVRKDFEQAIAQGRVTDPLILVYYRRAAKSQAMWKEIIRCRKTYGIA